MEINHNVGNVFVIPINIGTRNRMEIKKCAGYIVGFLVYYSPFKEYYLQMWGKEYDNKKRSLLFISTLLYFEYKYEKESDPKIREQMKELVMGKESAKHWIKFYENQPISNKIKEINKIIKQKKYKTTIIQVGSCCGKEINWLSKQNKKHIFIGIDIYKDVINYSNNKYKTKNLKFILCSAKNIDKVLPNKGKAIIFSSGSLKYVQPEHIKIFLKKIRKQTFVPLEYFNRSIYGGGLGWIHNYEESEQK